MEWVLKELKKKTKCGLYNNEKLKPGKQWYNTRHKEFFCTKCKEAMEKADGFRKIAENLTK